MYTYRRTYVSFMSLSWEKQCKGVGGKKFFKVIETETNGTSIIIITFNKPWEWMPEVKPIIVLVVFRGSETWLLGYD